ncbi:MAG: sigma-54-dependent Fis family transcriptional regulator [Planctomycetes bacterium]|nr:sigma-54-dependent Fis family transcriptional regulator [Planctomycetota bacterium]
MSRKKVLVVDDDEAIRAVLEYNLQESGLEVVSAPDAEAGWKLFQGDAPDLVITDVRMAGLSGMDLLAQIRQADPAAVVIVITAYGSVQQAVEAMKRGAHDYVTKPFDRDALKLTVRKALEFSSVRQENRMLRTELCGQFSLSRIIGASPAMQALLKLLARVAPTDATVLIQGETGTGKELVARAVHYNSARSSRNFVTVNCTAIPRELLESELFGHVKGAFTGAVSAKTGKFELAGGGTIFLDEIGDIELELQKKLLRVLQEREIDKVGSGSPLPVDVRVIAATNQPLARLVETGAFRKDLFYRLNVLPVHLPPLRERRDDIPPLVQHFLEKAGASHVRLTDAASALLLAHDWPGNVRELENAIERALIIRKNEGEIDAGDLALEKGKAEDLSPAPKVVELPEEGIILEEVEKNLIIEALRKTGGNQSAAARLLGISRQTLIYRMQKFAIRDQIS